VYFVCMYEKRTMKPAEIILTKGRGDEGESKKLN
jgi:hypothetical protein